MTRTDSNRLITFNRGLGQIGSKYALSNATLAAFAFPAYLTSLIFDYGRLGGNFFNWVIVGTYGYLAVIVSLVAIREVIRYFKLQPPAWLYLAFLFFAGLLRGLAIYLTGNGLKLFDESEFQFRVLGGPIYSGALLAICVILVSNISRERETQRQVESRGLVLQNRVLSMQNEIESQNSELLSRVRGLLVPVIDQVQNRISKLSNKAGAEDAVTALQETVEDVVRPLSHSVAEAIDSISDAEGAPSGVLSAPAVRLPKRLPAAVFFLPAWAAILGALILLPAANEIFGSGVAVLVVALFGASTYCVLKVIEVLIGKLQVPLAAAALIQLAAYAISAEVWVLLGSFLELKLPPNMNIQIIIFSLVFGSTFFVAQLAQYMRNLATENLKSVNDELEVLNSQMRQEIWLNRRRVATLLHGPIQGALYASAMRLSQAAKPSKKLIESVNQDITSALQSLQSGDFEPASLMDVLQQIKDLWDGVCQITIDVSTTDYVAITSQRTSELCTMEVVREAVSNAIKHGKAKKMTIKIYIDEENLIQVHISNDGTSSKANAEGFGTQLMRELTLEWRVENQDKRVDFYATIVRAV